MLDIELARRLRDAGLEWQPEEGDRFVVPGTVLQDRIFIINEMASMLEMYRGFPVITFHGTPEWALDYVHLGETVWLPYEGQLRARLAQQLALQGVTVYDLLFADDLFTCRFESGGEAVSFAAEDAEDAYGLALLYLLGPETASTSD